MVWRRVADLNGVALEKFLGDQLRNPRATNIDIVYVNGDNQLANARGPDETWEARLIEDEFRLRMFDAADRS